jgi:hypothetical protein
VSLYWRFAFESIAFISVLYKNYPDAVVFYNIIYFRGGIKNFFATRVRPSAARALPPLLRAFVKSPLAFRFAGYYFP